MENNNIIQEEVFAFPASAAQRRLWILSQFQGGNEAYNIMGVLRLQGSFRPDVLEQCVAWLAARHESLRTTFEKDNDTVLQVVHSHMRYTIPVEQLHGDDEQQALQELVKREMSQPFDLEKGPLLRIRVIEGTGARYLLCCMHHIISDGWSMGIFIREVSAAYNAFLHNRYPSLPEPDLQYSDYTLWQNDLWEQGGMQRHLNYWEARLKDAPALLELPLDFTRPHVQSFKGSAFEQVFDTETTGAVQALCRRYHTTPFIVLLAAFNVLLHRYTRQQDIVVGTPVANRGRRELEGIIGFFVNTLPLRAQVSPEGAFAALLEQLRESVPADFDHQQLSFEHLLELLPHRRSSSYHPLFQVMFTLESFGHDAIQWEGVEVTPVAPAALFSKFDLTLTIRDSAPFTAIWEYNTSLFEESTVRRMAGHFRHILQQVTREPLLPLQQVSLMDEAERQRILTDWNRTEVRYPAPYCLHTWFEQQAGLTPQRTAVQDDHTALTYQALDAYANRLAHYLLQQGLQPGQPVGISMERTVDMLAALLAVMKAGGTYVPVDPAYPAERKAYMLEDAKMSHVLTHSYLAASLPQQGIRLLAVDTLKAQLDQLPSGRPAVEVMPADPVYIIYTSGSTGQPKGARIPHGALVNLLRCMGSHTRIHENDRMLAITSLSFDIAGLELYLPLTAGATVVLAPREAARNGKAIMEYIDRHNITFMQATPATWLLLLDAGWPGKPDLKAVCCGEAFPRELANRLLRQTAAVWNGYGPTETTIFSAVYKVTPDNRANVPIGRPVANTTLYILDEQLQPVPAGIPGLLYIGGAGLAIDYYNKPELTAARFIPHPFAPGQRLYSTGDRACYLADGNIAFLGRADYQVKVNGYRIELEEIEYHLSLLEGVKQAVVTVITDASSMNRLVAYVADGGHRLSTDALRNALLRKLPAYMVPSLFVCMEALPLTPNGKVDRKALPDPDISRETLQTPYEAPATRQEKILAEIWQEVLEIERIGVYDNFFDLGGASLQSISVANKAAEAGLGITPEMIFEFQTVRELAPKATTVKKSARRQQQQELSITPDMLYPGPDAPPPAPAKRKNMLIESMACYLPEKIVPSKEVLEGCANAVRFPIERLTGVKSRRMAGEHEFAFDLAVKAMEKCFALSRYLPEDIDVLIACNIFRMDGKDRVTIDPATAVRLARHFGCKQALTFDVSNACAGAFTGLLLADSFLRNGSAARVMVVSGEYVTHVTKTQQPEIKDYLDQGIAALTIGDCGLAMILEPTADPQKGFIDLDLFTMGAYSDLCIIKASRQRPGFLMTTDAIRMMEAGHLETVKHALRMLIKNRWTPDMINFLIMHQASSIAITQTRHAINRFLNRDIAHANNVIDNIQHRGNTGTTTHWIAIQDHILNGTIKGGSNMLFYISGSGLNIGTALYAFDDLPERIAQYHETGAPSPKRSAPPARPAIAPGKRPARIRLVSAALAAPHGPAQPLHSALHWAGEAAKQCLQRAQVYESEIGLVLYAGLHRDDHIYEPAIASLLAGSLEINAYNNQPEGSPRTLSFDIFNGNTGFMQACYTAAQLMAANRCGYALVCTGEMENNALTPGKPLLDIYEGGAAWLLQPAAEAHSGFSHFLFHTYEADAAIQTWVQWEDGEPVVRSEKRPPEPQALQTALQHLVTALLQEAGLEREQVSYVIPPFADPQLTAALETALDMPGKVMNIAGVPADMQSLTLPCMMEALLQHKPQPGQIALLLTAGAGGQAGGAIYYC